MGKKFDSGLIDVIAENKKYISFNTGIVMGSYKDMWGRIKEKKIQLRLIDSISFMVSSLDLLARNLVGVNGMMCNQCKKGTELSHIHENYIAYGTCGMCRGDIHCKLMIDPIFDNLRVGHSDEQFRLLLREGVYPYEYMDDWEKFEENCLPPPPPLKCFTANSTRPELVSPTATTPREFRKSLG